MTKKNKASNREAAAEFSPAEVSTTDRNIANARNKRMRLRAAWMYYVEDKTQTEIADHLGIGRVTVTRLLSDARERNEVKFTIDSAVPECVNLERELELRFGLDEAVVAPLSDATSDATIAISAATGLYLSDFLEPGMKIGVGWGRTLLESLRYINEAPIADLSVVSLLGGITKVRQFNPSEFAWRFSSLVHGECYLMTAPAIVDAPETRRTLIEHCGLGEVFDRAKALDAVLISVGHMKHSGTAYRDGFLSDELRTSMIEHGAVGESLFHFFDADGKLVDHPIHNCVMAVPPDTIQNVPQRIIASGGPDKAAALLAAIRLFKPTVLITDEATAARLLELDGKK